MSGALVRNAAAALAGKFHSHLLRGAATHSIGRFHSSLRDFGRSSETQCRAYLRYPHLIGKAKGYGFSPSSFSSSFCCSSSSSFPKGGFVGWYLGMVKSRPVLTKSITASLIYIVADLSSQTITRTSFESYDMVRTARMAGYGLLILGPSLHFWFNLMSKCFPGRDLTTTFKKMALGQTVYGPSMSVIFFSTNASLQGENSSEIIARLRRDLLPTFLNGAMYWPFCDFITFWFVPVHLQPLVSNSFPYLWTVYMTYMASREKATAAELQNLANPTWFSI